MAKYYQQFLGVGPGISVELLDDSTSPYLVRTTDGFEFFVSAEDFRNYYKEENSPTPERWSHLITNPVNGTVNSRLIEQVMEIIHTFEICVQDFEKARSVVRSLARAVEAKPSVKALEILGNLEQLGCNPDSVSENDIKRIIEASPEIRSLLIQDNCAELPGPALDKSPVETSAKSSRERIPGEESEKKVAARVAKAATARMKNVAMLVDGDMLTIEMDLSKDFGPSKSGKTTIVASTEGNKSVPGRSEKIGLNVYKQEGKKAATGRKNSFKNMEMKLDGSILTITVDLSKEFGPSKSGKTVIIASSEGNQLVFGSSEKIGLNVYRKID
jgi:hypothetical protein